MKIVVASTASPELTHRTESVLAKAGHTLAAKGGQALVAIVNPHPDPVALSRVWEQAESAKSQGRPILAVVESTVIDLKGPVAHLPHSGEWLFLDTSEANVGQVVEAVDRLVPCKPKIFLAYSRRDKLPDNVARELRDRGYDVWVDKESIPGAKDWRVSNAKAIREANALVILFSPNALKRPENLRDEINYAMQCKVKVVPVELLRIAALPEGLDLALSGLQRIPLYQDFATGIEKICEIVGEARERDSGRGIVEKYRRTLARARIFSQQHEIGQKAKNYGSTLAAGAVAGAAIVAGAAAKRSEEQQEQYEERQKQDIAEYAKETLDLLKEMHSEVMRAHEMSYREYREFFLPRYHHILGKLEATTPPTVAVSISRRHQHMVTRLMELERNFDEAQRKRGEQDENASKYAIENVNKAWEASMHSFTEWLIEAVKLAR
ncbi:toll/interleukin-1 receptor domain-containing protein [Streptomyces sp. NPDC059467]|uniref:toll/interleukin-1 receptor domain-containing protein n=1 Tax=Streptomyces sp. NPDC059467 TaxID=3346844 RepID=UPI00368A1AF6